MPENKQEMQSRNIQWCKWQLPNTWKPECTRPGIACLQWLKWTKNHAPRHPANWSHIRIFMVNCKQIDAKNNIVYIYIWYDFVSLQQATTQKCLWSGCCANRFCFGCAMPPQNLPWVPCFCPIRNQSKNNATTVPLWNLHSTMNHTCSKLFPQLPKEFKLKQNWPWPLLFFWKTVLNHHNRRPLAVIVHAWIHYSNMLNSASWWAFQYMGSPIIVAICCVKNTHVNTKYNIVGVRKHVFVVPLYVIESLPGLHAQCGPLTNADSPTGPWEWMPDDFVTLWPTVARLSSSGSKGVRQTCPRTSSCGLRSRSFFLTCVRSLVTLKCSKIENAIPLINGFRLKRHSLDKCVIINFGFASNSDWKRSSRKQQAKESGGGFLSVPSLEL